MSTEIDREILNNIFNPLLPNGSLQFDDNVPVEIPGKSCQDSNLETTHFLTFAKHLCPESDELITQDVLNSKRLELEGIAAAEREDYEKALQLFSLSIETAPQRASCYNNRAQTLRLVGRIEGELCTFLAL